MNLKNKKSVFIATSRLNGEQCKEWARENLPEGFFLSDTMEDAEIIISVLYDKILSKNLIKNRKCYNFHPGTLPKYKGAGIYSWVILNQEKKMGITLHTIEDGIDNGKIIEIREFLIMEDDTAFSLHTRGNDVMYKMFKDWFSDLLHENYLAVEQPRTDGEIYYRRKLQNQKNLSKFIKAFHFPGKESAYFFNKEGEKIYINYNKE
jgi:methionyl-tRNA formyltransferase